MRFDFDATRLCLTVSALFSGGCVQADGISYYTVSGTLRPAADGPTTLPAEIVVSLRPNDDTSPVPVSRDGSFTATVTTGLDHNVTYLLGMPVASSKHGLVLPSVFIGPVGATRLEVSPTGMVQADSYSGEITLPVLWINADGTISAGQPLKRTFPGVVATPACGRQQT